MDGSGPEVSHLVFQCEAVSQANDATQNTRRHEQTERNQRQGNKLTKVIGDPGNPFQEESKDQLTLDTKDIAHPNGAERIHTHFERGTIRFEELIHGLEKVENLTFYEPIKNNKIDFFRQVTAVDGKHKVLEEDCYLFSKLFVSCQSRECNLQEFFQHENQQPFSAALSDSGKLHTCQKFQLVAILKGCLTNG